MAKVFYFIPFLGVVGLVVALVKPNSNFNSATAGIVVGVLSICLTIYAAISTKSGIDEYVRQSMSMMQMLNVGVNINFNDVVENKLGVGAYLLVLSGIMLTIGGWKLSQTESE